MMRRDGHRGRRRRGGSALVRRAGPRRARAGRRDPRAHDARAGAAGSGRRVYCGSSSWSAMGGAGMVAGVVERGVIGVDLGGTKLLAGAVDADLAIHHRTNRPIYGLDQNGLVQMIADAVQEIRTAVGDGIEAVGFGIPCTFDARTGMAVQAANAPLADIAFHEVMAERLGLPVAVDNDANCAVLCRGARRAPRRAARRSSCSRSAPGSAAGWCSAARSTAAGSAAGRRWATSRSTWTARRASPTARTTAAWRPCAPGTRSCGWRRWRSRGGRTRRSATRSRRAASSPGR